MTGVSLLSVGFGEESGLGKNWRGKIAWILFALALGGNFFWIYVIFDHVITDSYAEMDRARYIRQRTDALAFLNLTLESHPSFDFVKVRDKFLSRTNNPFGSFEKEGYIVLGELCFKKSEKVYQANYCGEME